MGKKYSKKVHQEPLRKEWAQSLLAMRDPNGVGSLYEGLEAAKAALALAVGNCRNHMGANSLTDVVADAAAREAGRGGKASITVNEQGTILLEVRPKKAVEKRNWKTSLPPIKVLRAEAKEMNLDITEYGRSKRDIHDAIQAAKAEASPAKPKIKPKAKKMTRTGDAITKPRVVQANDLPFDDSTALPDDLLDGESPDLQVVLADSEGLDLDAILDGNKD